MLTPREHEIATLATAGLRNREIARRLHLTEGTVKSHLHNIYQKAGIKNRTTLTARFHDRPSANGHAPNFVDATGQSGRRDQASTCVALSYCHPIKAELVMN
jgi:DNA-binding CsgD family transcriptional regulator